MALSVRAVIEVGPQLDVAQLEIRNFATDNTAAAL